MKKIIDLGLSLSLGFLFCGYANAAEINAEYSADNCEFYVNGFVLTNAYLVQTSKYATSYVSVDEVSLVKNQGGTVLRVGAVANGENFILGEQIAPAYYSIKIDIISIVYGAQSGAKYQLQRFAYFVDVKRANGQIERLWLSNGGKDFAWPQVFDAYPRETRMYAPGTGRGYEQALLVDAFNVSPIFNQKLACTK